MRIPGIFGIRGPWRIPRAPAESLESPESVETKTFPRSLVRWSINGIPRIVRIFLLGFRCIEPLENRNLQMLKKMFSLFLDFPDGHA